MSNHTSRRSPKKSPKRLVVWKDQAQLDARRKAAEEEAWKVAYLISKTGTWKVAGYDEVFKSLRRVLKENV